MLFGFLHIAVKVKTGFIMLRTEEEFCNLPQRRSIDFFSFLLTMGIDDTDDYMGTEIDHCGGKRVGVSMGTYPFLVISLLICDFPAWLIASILSQEGVTYICQGVLRIGSKNSWSSLLIEALLLLAKAQDIGCP